MPKMGLSCFTDGYYATDLVAPKSDYETKEKFVSNCAHDYDGYEWSDKIKVENVQEGHCRYYPKPPEGCDFESGCYSFSKPGPGAFPVWRIDLQR